MEYSEAEWVESVVGTAEAPQTCLNSLCGDSVECCFVFQHRNCTVAYATAPLTTPNNSGGVRCPQYHFLNSFPSKVTSLLQRTGGMGDLCLLCSTGTTSMCREGSNMLNLNYFFPCFVLGQLWKYSVSGFAFVLPGFLGNI